MNKLLNDITTGPDNQTHEIIRVFSVVIIALTVFISLVGTGIELCHYIQTGQFDLQSFFQAQITFLLGVGTFLLTVSGSIKLKSKNDQPPSLTASSTTTTLTQTAGATQ